MSIFPPGLVPHPQIRQLVEQQLELHQAKAVLSAWTPASVAVDDLAWMLKTLLCYAEPLPALPDILQKNLIDCSGTGGSGLERYNTSTTVAFVLAAADIPVMKFGNRSVTGLSGSFDFLGKLGFEAWLPLEAIPTLLDETGLVFLFAPQCYPALAPIQDLRKQLLNPTVFNYLGPLMNPYRPPYRLMGISNSNIHRKVAQILQTMPGNMRSLVVRGHQNLDELTPDGPSTTYMVEPEIFYEGTVRPELLLKGTPTPSLPFDGTLAEQNAQRFHAMITGEDTHTADYWAVCLNAGAAFSITGTVTHLEEGIRLAQQLLQEKAVAAQYQKTLSTYQQLATGV